MREIKFRGYCKDELIGSQWVTNGYGVFNIDYVNGKRDTFLITPYGDYYIYEESVGQYTGLKDINNIEICEGDIVSFYNDEEYKLNPTTALVVYEVGAFMLEHKKLGKEYLGEIDIENMCVKVIGNIYENPELLKMEE